MYYTHTNETHEVPQTSNMKCKASALEWCNWFLWYLWKICMSMDGGSCVVFRNNMRLYQEIKEILLPWTMHHRFIKLIYSLFPFNGWMGEWWTDNFHIELFCPKRNAFRAYDRMKYGSKIIIIMHFCGAKKFTLKQTDAFAWVFEQFMDFGQSTCFYKQQQIVWPLAFGCIHNFRSKDPEFAKWMVSGSSVHPRIMKIRKF